MNQGPMRYCEPFDWFALTPLFPGEPIVSYSKQKVWFLEAPYMGNGHAQYKPEVLPIELYWNMLLMKGKIT